MLRHEIVDDVEAEAGVALAAVGGEKRIEDVALHIARDADTVIRKRDLDLLAIELARLDQHASRMLAGEAVREGVEDEIGQYLPVGAGVAVQRDLRRYVERDRIAARLRQPRPDTGDDLLGHDLEVEGPPVGMAAIDGHLLERLDQLTRTLKIGYQLVRRVAATLGELVELGAAHVAGRDLLGEGGAAVCER